MTKARLAIDAQKVATSIDMDVPRSLVPSDMFEPALFRLRYIASNQHYHCHPSRLRLAPRQRPTHPSSLMIAKRHRAFVCITFETANLLLQLDKIDIFDSIDTN